MPPTSPAPNVLLESFSPAAFPHSYRFEGLESVVTAHSPEEVVPALQAVERAVARGRHAAGFVSYEAASGLNPDLAVAEPDDLPLVWFGIFTTRHECKPEQEHAPITDCSVSPPVTAVSEPDYAHAIADIRKAIAAGETYQVNFTTRQHFTLQGDPFALYRRMCRNQRAPFCAWIDCGSHRILSASPELFFTLQWDRLTMRPMNGTTTRLPLPADDRRQRTRLAASVKERAENLMIVDLVRNDLSTIAETGSVEVPALFEVETYPTVHQMTSTVCARLKLHAGLVDIFRAVFPCGSVTGAPKRRTMEIIQRLEDSPRGIYCGAIGFLSPGREAVFSVAIRTVTVAPASGDCQMGIGSGVTWDSNAAAEYRECLTKGEFLSRDSRPFQLLESLRHDDGEYLFMEQHLQRLAASAAWFGFGFDEQTVRNRLDEVGRKLTGAHKVRLLLAEDGTMTLEANPIHGLYFHAHRFHNSKNSTNSPLTPCGGGLGRGGGCHDIGELQLPPPPDPLPPGEGGNSTSPAFQTIAVAEQRVDSADPFLFHKTTRRDLFDQELRAHPGCSDVLFLNERGEVTEGSYNNIVICAGGELMTPALSCGLLPGVLRGELLDAGIIREAVLTLESLATAERIWLINSVRGWRECRMQI